MINALLIEKTSKKTWKWAFLIQAVTIDIDKAVVNEKEKSTDHSK